MAAVEECCPRCFPLGGAYYAPIIVGHCDWLMYASSAPNWLLCRLNPFPLKPYTPSRKTVAKRVSDDIVCFEQEHGFANVSAVLAVIMSRVLLSFEVCESQAHGSLKVWKETSWKEATGLASCSGCSATSFATLVAWFLADHWCCKA